MTIPISCQLEVILINVILSPKIVLLSYNFFDFFLTCYCTLQISFSSEGCYLENGFERVSVCFLYKS